MMSTEDRVVIQRLYDGTRTGCLLIDDTRVAGNGPIGCLEGNVINTWKPLRKDVLKALGIRDEGEVE